MSNKEILRILSPLLLFLFHVIYLIAVSKDPFFNKWIDGSFSFFLSLVLCNIIRSRVVAQASQDLHADDPGGGEDGREKD